MRPKRKRSGLSTAPPSLSRFSEELAFRRLPRLTLLAALAADVLSFALSMLLAWTGLLLTGALLVLGFVRFGGHRISPF